MNKIMIFLLGISLLAGQACKSDSDVLATFNKEGKITRGDFHKWLEGRRLKLENILKKKSQQKTKLRQQALEILSAEEAKKAGFDKTEEYKFLINLYKRNIIQNYYIKQLRESGDFKDEIVKAKIIKLYVRDFKIDNNKRIKLSEADVEKAFQEKVKKAKEIIKELDGGKDFSELAKKHSDDFTKKKGGDIGFISRGMRGEDFSKAVFALKKGEYTKEPVRIRKAIYIIKCEERETVTSDTVGDVIDDKNQAERLKKRLSHSYIKNYEKSLSDAKDVKKSFDKIPANKAAVLFSIGETAFKVSDLNSVIDFIYKRRKSKKVKFDDKLKKNMVERIFREELLQREAYKKGVDKEEKFLTEWRARELNILANFYRDEVLLKDIKVDNKEVVEEYNKNKDRAYTKREKKGKNTTKKVIPLNEVRDRIQFMLLNKKKSFKRREWENKVIKESNFKINENKLEGE